MTDFREPGLAIVRLKSVFRGHQVDEDLGRVPGVGDSDEECGVLRPQLPGDQPGCEDECDNRPNFWRYGRTEEHTWSKEDSAR